MIFYVIFYIVPAVVLLEPPEPFDFVEDALAKYVNHSVDPCDNFYRHACSFNSPSWLINEAFRNLNSYLEELRNKSAFNDLTILNDYNKFQDKLSLVSGSDATIEFFVGFFDSVCSKKDDIASTLFESIEDIINNYGHMYRSQRKEIDTNDCSTLSQQLKASLEISKSITDSLNINTLLFDTNKRLSLLVKTIKVITSHLEVDVRRGIEEIRRTTENVVGIALNLIEETPWARNMHVVEEIKNVTSQVTMNDNYGKDFKEIAQILMKLEDTFINCKATYGAFENGDFFCFVLSSSKFREPDVIYDHFFMEDNARNERNKVFLDIQTTITSSMVEGNGPQHLPYFSAKVIDCVQNQYNSTCNKFNENGCNTNEDNLDDNGADIFGLQVAYELLETYYADNLRKTIDRLGITYQKLFFYSYAFNFCRGEQSTYQPDHSAHNIRINVVAQNPGFQEAFQCSEDSPMMQSATEQCFIYGRDAPEIRRRKFSD